MFTCQERGEGGRRAGKTRGWTRNSLKIRIRKTATNEVWIETYMYETAEEIMEQAFEEQHV